MLLSNGTHLSYCTNVHPGQTLTELQASLQTHTQAVATQLRAKALLAQDSPLGLGVRLSNQAAQELASPEAFLRFESWCKTHGFYHFTFNGFPYGPFHGTAVKDSVYQPDWRRPERLAYTNGLFALLARLAAAAPSHNGAGHNDAKHSRASHSRAESSVGPAGTISTVPGAYKAHLGATAAERAAGVQQIAHALLKQAHHLYQLEQDSGLWLALALEPEPDCLLETTTEVVQFFKTQLLSPPALAQLSAWTGINSQQAEALLLRYVGVCLDTCHAAVEFETPKALLAQLSTVGIQVYKAQLSAGLLLQATPEALKALESFDEAVYLHQVVSQLPSGELLRFADIPQALAYAARTASVAKEQWRVHFHVPIFDKNLDVTLNNFESTQPFLADFLALQRQTPITRHLEVETYTWDVLPEHLRQRPIAESIAAELQWVLRQLGECL